ncbi:MAG: hypothetical protein ACQERB_02075 [Promethearchaeati archaeon]
MYCPICGSKLESDYQRYCQNCGTEIFSHEEYPYKIKETQSKEFDKYEKKEHHEIKPKDYNTIPKKEEIQASSLGRKCLSYAIASVVLSGIGIGLSGIKLYRNWMYGYILPEIPALGIIFSGFSLLFSVLGLIFAIISKSYSSKARRLTPYDIDEEKGSNLLILGLILSLITLGLSSLGLIRSLISIGFINFSYGFFII